MRPSAPQFEQVQTIAESRATAASTVFFRHLKHLGAAGGCPVAFEACATTSAWNCAIALAGPFVGPIVSRVPRNTSAETLEAFVRRQDAETLAAVLLDLAEVRDRLVRLQRSNQPEALAAEFRKTLTGWQWPIQFLGYAQAREFGREPARLAGRRPGVASPAALTSLRQCCRVPA